MIDAFSIIFSTLMCMFVVLRAVKLDRVLPWYGPTNDISTNPHATEAEQPEGATWKPDWDSGTPQ